MFKTFFVQLLLFYKKIQISEASGEESHTLPEYLFNENLLEIAKHNSVDKKILELCVNHFFNMTEEQIRNSLGPYDPEKHKVSKMVGNLSLELMNGIPKEYDWREQNAVLPAKDQGTCNACWSFTAAAIIETHVYKITGKLKRLSRQQGLDCFGGCSYKEMDQVFNLFQDLGGISTEECYGIEYLNENNTIKYDCKYKPKCPGAKIIGFKRVTELDEVEMARIISTIGPVSAWIKVPRSLLFYKSGIYHVRDCEIDKNIFGSHIITIVGYGIEKGMYYWLIKNSWGDDWGDKGFGKLLRNINFCGIASYNYYPIVIPIN